jgi:hypothetical protein
LTARLLTRTRAARSSGTVLIDGRFACNATGLVYNHTMIQCVVDPGQVL